MFAKISLEEFVSQAASDAPTPGGGAIAALAGSLGTAMASMAANFTVGRPKYAAVEAQTRGILSQLSPLIIALFQGVDRDAVAFGSINAAYKLPKGTESEKVARAKAIHESLLDAIEVPQAVLGDCVAAAELLPSLASIANPNLLSDVEVAAIMLDAAGRAARVNVLVNSSQLQAEEGAKYTEVADKAVERLAVLLEETLREVAKRRR